jgi:hypothetical protein
MHRSPWPIAWAVACLLAAGILSYFVYGAFGPAHLFKADTKIDLGNVYVGQVVEKSLLLTNSTSRPMEIMRWALSCHCVQVNISGSDLAPHTAMNAVIGTKASRPLGKKAVAVIIDWRFRGESVVHEDSFRVNFANVSSIFLPTEEIEYGRVNSQAQDSVRTIFVSPGNIDRNWNGLEVVSDSKNLSARVVKDGDEFQIESRLSCQVLPSGSWKSVLRVFPTMDGKRTGEEVDVPAEAQIEGTYSVDPQVILFSAVDSNHPLSFSLAIHSKGPPISRLIFVNGEQTVQDQKIEILKKRNEAVMSGVLAKHSANGLFVGTISIQINDAHPSNLEIPFMSVPRKTSPEE